MSVQAKKPRKAREKPTAPLFTASKAVRSWGSLEEKAITSVKKPTIIDEILRDLEKKKAEAYEYDLNVNAYTGVMRASKAEKPRIEVKVLGSEGEGVDRVFKVAIRRLKG
jgi:hypothetical protein